MMIKKNMIQMDLKLFMRTKIKDPKLLEEEGDIKNNLITKIDQTEETE